LVIPFLKRSLLTYYFNSNTEILFDYLYLLIILDINQQKQVRLCSVSKWYFTQEFGYTKEYARVASLIITLQKRLSLQNR